MAGGLAGATLHFLSETNETNETAGGTFHLRTVLNCFKLLRRNYAQESLPGQGSGWWSERGATENFTAALGTQFCARRAPSEVLRRFIHRGMQFDGSVAAS